MFDIGFSELVVIGLVALVVIGPERLPRVARTVGHLLGRLQRYVSDVKADIHREMQIEDLKKLQQQVAESARELESSMRSQVSALESGARDEMAKARVEFRSDVDVAAGTGSPSPLENGSRLLDAHLGEANALAGSPAFPSAVDGGPGRAKSERNQLELGLESGGGSGAPRREGS
ncbi:MAG: twin-arginine translocase subunit TatB [Zoogloeaceae bacterium]|nr:twin-arginine translocase subunit TatB [Zoogloeaceae bacterium]